MALGYVCGPVNCRRKAQNGASPWSRVIWPPGFQRTRGGARWSRARGYFFFFSLFSFKCSLSPRSWKILLLLDCETNVDNLATVFNDVVWSNGIFDFGQCIKKYSLSIWKFHIPESWDILLQFSITNIW